MQNCIFDIYIHVKIPPALDRVGNSVVSGPLVSVLWTAMKGEEIPRCLHTPVLSCDLCSLYLRVTTRRLKPAKMVAPADELQTSPDALLPEVR